MGYRARLGRFPKVDHKKFKHLKTEQEAYQYFEDHHSGYAHYRPPGHQELVELGKYVNYAKETHLNAKPFYDFDLEETEFVIVDRDFLLHIIEEYRKNTAEWYVELLETIQTGDTAMVEQHVRTKVSEWDNKFYSTLKTDEIGDNDTDGHLTRSWKFEYAVFNLLHILHTFDWDNDYLIYSGW